MFIALHRSGDEPDLVPVRHRRRRALPPRPVSARSGHDVQVITTGRPLRHRHAGGPTPLGRSRSADPTRKSWLGVPITGGNRVIGRARPRERPGARLHRGRRAPPRHARVEHGRGPRERPPVRRDEAAPRRDERAGGRARGDQRDRRRRSPRQLEFQAIIDLVGEQVRSIFDPHAMFIALYDETTNLVDFPYRPIEGERAERDCRCELGSGLTSTSSSPAGPSGSDPTEGDGAAGRSSSADRRPNRLSASPITERRRVTGAVALERLEKDAFAESDERLLTTLATSMGVALENARLFDETRRLLTETNERAAELALINDVQRGLAERLDMQAMYDLVGDRIQAIFDAQVVDIGIVDRETRPRPLPVHDRAGRAVPGRADPAPRASAEAVIETGKPMMVSEAELLADVRRRRSDDRPGRAAEVRAARAAELRRPASAGVISLQNLDRDGAFSDSDVELLTTLAASLSVALENVRLIDETRQRLAELATVNEVGNALATQLDLDNLLDLVGEEVRRTFEADLVYVALLDAGGDRRSSSRTTTRTASRADAAADGLRRGPDVADHRRARAAAPEPGVGLGGDREPRRRDAGEVLSRRADPHRRPGDRRDQRPEHDRRRAASGKPTPGCWRRSPRTSASRSRTPACSRRPTAAATRWRSSPRSARRSRRRSTRRSSSSGSASASTRCCAADTTALYLAEPDGRTFRAILALGEIADAIRADVIIEGEGIIGDVIRTGAPEFVNDAGARPARPSTSPAPRMYNPDDRPADGRPAASPATASPASPRSGASGGEPFDQADLDFLVGLARQASIAIENSRLFRHGPGGAGRRRGARTRRRAPSSRR